MCIFLFILADYLSRKCYLCISLFVMSQFVIYLKLKPYLAEWLVHSLGVPVCFPHCSNENAIIRTFLQKQPLGKVEKQTDGMVAIVIPDSKAKPVSTYNYLGEHGKKALPIVIVSFNCKLRSPINHHRLL